MLILRIRQAEVAMKDGRLDEAFELARRPDFAAHRRGQDVIGRLVRRLADRGQEHLSSERVAQALVDCEKAQQLGGNLPELIELRAAATDLLSAKQRAQRVAAYAFNAARQKVEAGMLSAGRALLACGNTNDTRAGVLLQEIDAKQSMLDSAVKNAESALARKDIDAAMAELSRARAADVNDKRLIDVAGRAGAMLRTQAQDAINNGRLDLAQPLVDRAVQIDNRDVESEHLARALSQCRLAWERIDRGRPHDAEEILRRLIAIFPKASWIHSTLKTLKAANEAVEELRAGPLGLLSTTSFKHDAPTQVPPSRSTGDSPVPVEHGRVAHVTDGAIPNRFVLQVDGAGSVLVVRSSIVSIGPVSSSKAPDVGLVTEPGAPVVTIERKDEDYFIRGGGLFVNDQPTSQKLLAAGDRIALTSRCRMHFAMPSAASTSASLDLTGARYPRSDIRRVVLMDSDLVIGPGASSHVKCEGATEPIVLHVRDGRLMAQCNQPVEVNGSPVDRTRGIPLGSHVRIGPVTFVVTKA